MKKIVFIETNFSGLDAIQYCRRKGYHTVLVSDSYDRFKKWFPSSSLPILDEVSQLVEVKDSNNISEVKNALIDQVGDFDALLTFAEIRILVTAELAREFNLPGADPVAIRIAQDKYRFRQVLREKGVDNVQCQKISSAYDLLRIKYDISYPCFLKPVQGHSSIGALVCEDINQVEGVIELLAAIKEDWISPEFVVEDYLQGELYSVELLTTGKGKHHVVGISDRDIVNSCVEIGSSFPVVGPLSKKIEDKARAALDAIGYEFGPSHIEMIVDNGEPHLVEINARVGGSGHSIMLALATSRSIVGDYVELCLGQLEESENLYSHAQGAAWKCFVSNKPGKIISLPSETDVKSQFEVDQVWIHRNIGETVDISNSNYSWIMQVMCVGKDQSEAKENAATVIKYIAENAHIA